MFVGCLVESFPQGLVALLFEFLGLFSISGPSLFTIVHVSLHCSERGIVLRENRVVVLLLLLGTFKRFPLLVVSASLPVEERLGLLPVFPLGPPLLLFSVLVLKFLDLVFKFIVTFLRMFQNC